jgi:hypothetical protein
MSALSDIQREIDRLMALAEHEAGRKFSPAQQRWAKAQRLQVNVGTSAEQSILAITGDPQLPDAIDDVPVVRTEAFDGFEVVIR